MKKFVDKIGRIIAKELFLLIFILTPLIMVLPFTLDVKNVSASPGPVGSVGLNASIGPIGDPGPVALEGGDTALANNATGYGSDNVNTTSADSSLDVNQSSDAQIKNDADANLNSGKNNITSNTGVGDVTTGNIDSSNSFVNIANSSFAPGSQVSAATLDGADLSGLTLGSAEPDIVIPIPSGSNDLSDSITGSRSDNFNKISKNNSITFLGDNFSTADNTIDINANTGLNTIAENTIVGDITTGDINLANSLINLQNFINPQMIVDLGIITVLNGLNGDIIPSNYVTGPNSDNSNLVNQNNNILVDLDNNAAVTNNSNYNLNTGQNTIANNTSTGDLTTGDSNVENRVFNWLNPSNLVLNVINVFGKWAGSFLPGLSGNYIVNQSGADPIYYSGSSPVSNLTDSAGLSDLNNGITGANSENSNIIDQSLDINADINQNAKADNIFKISAETGRNNISRNTEVGNISTGSINVLNNVVNVLNNFGSKAGKLKIHFVNIFGNWLGNLGKRENEAAAPMPVSQVQPEEYPATTPEVLGEVYLGEALPAAGDSLPIYLYLGMGGMLGAIIEVIRAVNRKKSM